VPEVRERVHWVSRHAGGRGAVREFVELVLRARERWTSIVAIAERL
jgi:3-deoxy-D-manno-octulosonate 8-phosphate phosphatase (KDO 8-P phosphatase)